MFRCQGPDGSLIFTDDPSRCPQARPHEPRGRVVTSPSPAPARRAAPAPRLDEGALRALFPPRTAQGGWEVVEEPLDTGSDPALRTQGLRASLARHYTRYAGPVSEVCTLELWDFAAAAQAEAVRAALARPGWWARAAGGLLVLAHGVRMEREVGSQAGLVPGCTALATAAHARALGRGGRPLP